MSNYAFNDGVDKAFNGVDFNLSTNGGAEGIRH